ncbi:hypothetical protein FE236_06490 [Mariprofundus erugo]|uniref:hypothetical protein n=1 Tax=Mariprofundus erugo TaxID=2528639 RepID=UPI0010FD17F3|nr:hypothetical protein [Mariprofundus erugo]TLS76500.1 hypothetical protein FE236_06490 [Mariprofundus erugo]
MTGERSGVAPDCSRVLAEHGLNLQAVFNLSDLPDGIRASIAGVRDVHTYRQMIVFGHGGPALWRSLSASGCMQGENPVDHFSAEIVARYFASENPDHRYCLLYPDNQLLLPLQQLGELAGWHHPSPFRLGINQYWGSWFAYRAVVLADSSFPASKPLSGASPCQGCATTPCMAACPVSVDGSISLNDCMDERSGEGSACAFTCLARLACPVRQEMRYEPAQMAYHYGCSLATIRSYRASSAE